MPRYVSPFALHRRAFRALGAAFAVLTLALLLAGRAPAHAVELHVLNLALIGPGVSCTEALAKGANTVAGAVADGSQGIVLCAHVEDAATGTDQGGIPVVFTVTVGSVGSTGTTKSTTVLTSASGVTSISYRGGGGTAGADTAVASYAAGGAAATEDIVLTAPSGRSAAKLVLGTPSVSAIAPAVSRTSPRYSSPAIGALLALQVQDAAGAGVNGRAVLLTVDRGALVADPAFAASANAVCMGAGAKSLALVTSATNLALPGGQATPGYVNFAVCADELDPPGSITVTALDAGALIPGTTASLSQAGVPARIEASADGSTVTARVTDAAGNPVADGTPVRFVTPAALGSMTAACALTSGGVASSLAALNAAGTVIASADYNETGSVATASTCGAPGARQLSRSVTAPAAAPVASRASTTPASAPAGSIPPAGGFGFLVFGGGTAAQLLAASGCPPATAAFYGLVGGDFVAYVPAAPATVNAAFEAAYPGDISPGTVFIGRCR